MNIASLAALYDLELGHLAAELEQYSSDTIIWSVHPGISNSGGTLVLHICGNLRHFIGAVLGNTGYVRNREAEFTTRGLGKKDLLEIIATARSEVGRAMEGIEESAVTSIYPLQLANQSWETGRLMIHLYGHLQYHRGQVSYHRRFSESGWMY